MLSDMNGDLGMSQKVNKMMPTLSTELKYIHNLV